MDLLLGTARSTLHAVDADWLRWMTPDGVVPSRSERAEAEAERARAEAERADRLAAELAELKARLSS